MLSESHITATQLAPTTPVRTLFEQPAWYFSRRAFEIRIRAETVQQLLNSSEHKRVLDIGCGDGSLSLQLLDENTNVTLLDFSTSMLSKVQANVPPRFSQNAKLVHADFVTAPIHPGSFDVILCVGVLAHVGSPAAVISKVASLLEPGGCVIVECTDSRHFLSRWAAWVTRAWSMFKPSRYTLQDLTPGMLDKSFATHQLYRVATFRYCAPLPGLHRLLSQETLYRLTRRVFGSATASKNQWLGNEHIAVFAPRGGKTRSSLHLMFLGFCQLTESMAAFVSVM